MAIHRYSELDSTQDEARRRINAGLAGLGDVIVCDRQRVGRGRFGRPWISPRGGLYATFLVVPRVQWALAAGVAAAEALRRLGLDVRLKWPNDLFIDERKIGGILIETAGEIGLVGIGINLVSSPDALATCSREHGVACDRDALVADIALRLAAPASEHALSAYRDLSATLGKTVRIEQRATTFVGRAVDLDDQGRLIVDTGRERITIVSGDCIHLRGVPRVPDV